MPRVSHVDDRESHATRTPKSIAHLKQAGSSSTALTGSIRRKMKKPVKRRASLALKEIRFVINILCCIHLLLQVFMSIFMWLNSSLSDFKFTL